MLTDERLEFILGGIPRLTIGVVGDLFLDRYLDIDPVLTEKSVETGLDAYQVVRVRNNPGAAGTVINNLVALGVKTVCPIAVIGDDGEGHDLCMALLDLGVGLNYVFPRPSRRTPTYTKPMLGERELNRLDIKNRSPLPADMEEKVMATLDDLFGSLDALVVVDQVSEADCGVITWRVREKLGRLGESHPEKLILADSRERIGMFRNVWLKPNQRECVRALRPDDSSDSAEAKDIQKLARDAGRPVFCTCGERGIIAVDPRGCQTWEVMAAPVTGPIDPVGAGDSVSAAIASAVAAGATIPEAAAFGNLVASITVQQIGTTGTASPEQIRIRWAEVRKE